MKNKPFEMCLLFDFYGDILTEKQRELFDLYYNEDLSLSEISEHVGITRQGVRDAVARSEHILRDMEEKLGLVARYGPIQAEVEQITSLVQEISLINDNRYRNQEIAGLARQALEIAARISE